MNRRAFLATCGRSLAGTVASILPPFVRDARAMDPATALAIVKIGMDVAGLFSQGPGVAQLLHLQTEMLRAISGQLAAIQKGILEILSRLNDIETLLGKIPEQVVIELYRAKIAGLNDRYKELMSTYKSDVATHGIAVARANSANELENELLRPLREARDILMTYKAFALVPIVCTSAFVETHAMIMADYRKARMLSAIQRYQEWLETVSIGQSELTLQGAIAANEKKYAELKLPITEKRAEDFTCLSQLKGGSLPGQSNCGPGGLVNMYGTYKTLRATSVGMTSVTPEIDSAVKDMVSHMALPEKDRPVKAMIEFSVVNDGTPFGICRMFNAEHPFDRQCQPQQDARNRSAAQLSESLVAVALSLMSLRSLEFASNTGMRFLKRFGSDVKKA